MLVESVFNIFLAAIRALLSPLWLLIPAPPDWFAAHAGDIQVFWDYVGAFNTWVPVSLAFTVAGAVLASTVVGWAIGVVRVIVSYLTLGGGAT